MIYWFSAGRGHIDPQPMRKDARKMLPTCGRLRRRRRRQRRVRVEKFPRFYSSSFFYDLERDGCSWWAVLRWSGRDPLCCWQDMEILLSCCISENMVYGHKTLSVATVWEVSEPEREKKHEALLCASSNNLYLPVLCTFQRHTFREPERRKDQPASETPAVES